jgi:hypothetical protein
MIILFFPTVLSDGGGEYNMATMKLKGFCVVWTVCLLVVLAACSSKPATSNDAPSGTWSGDYGPDADRRESISVDLRWEATNLRGVVHSGVRSLPLSKASFTPETGTIAMEFDAQGNGGRTVHYVIEGKVTGNTMSGTWTREDQRGDFRVTKQ